MERDLTLLKMLVLFYIMFNLFSSDKESKEAVIDSLYKLMCTGTSSQSDNRVSNNDYFKRRVLGFRAEMEFESFVGNTNNFKFIEGGMLFSSKLDGTVGMKNQFQYITFDDKPAESYTEIYNKIASWDEVKSLVYAQIIFEDWGTEGFVVKENDKEKNTHILKPKYKFFKFNPSLSSFTEFNVDNLTDILEVGRDRVNKKPSKFKLRKREQFEYFNEYDLQTLKKIYANRYFIDFKKRFKVANMIDFDGFILSSKSCFLVEVKEKNPINAEDYPDEKERWSYGWDTRRLLWYLYIQEKLDIDILYTIRRINNRQDREFIQWDSVFLSDFLKVVSWSASRQGGGGEDTLTVPFNHFKKLSEQLKET